jgi:hypothetical protein
MNTDLDTHHTRFAENGNDGSNFQVSKNILSRIYTFDKKSAVLRFVAQGSHGKYSPSYFYWCFSDKVHP